MGMAQELRLSSASPTRWLSYDIAVSKFVRMYPAVVATLTQLESERSCPKAHGFLRVVMTWRFVHGLHMLRLILPRLANLSKKFQVSFCSVMSLFLCFISLTVWLCLSHRCANLIPVREPRL